MAQCSVISVVVLVLFCSSVLAFNATVQTKYGWVSGTLDSAKTHTIWYGVPYAQPPVGSLRWKLPQAPLNWTGVKSTINFGAACSQPGVTSSEDCLFLNINTPVNWTTGNPLLPVMIWIHGGSFWGGSGAVRPAFLAANDMVFVSINYRLGAFGFFNLPSLLNASTEHTAGFYGIQDQRFAFLWVKENIRFFGGDPNRVTISGQSAGAMSVCIHVAAPRSGGLFQRALMESGSCNQFLTTAQATTATTNVATKLNCTGANILPCLYNRSADAINTAMIYGPIWPSFNPYEIQAQPIDYIKNGTYNKVPLLAGTNHDEQSFETCPSYSTINTTQYNVTFQKIYPYPTYLYVQKMYLWSTYSPPVAGITAAWTDSRFRYPTLDMVSAMANHQQLPIYIYSFNQVPSFQTDPCLNVSHSDELNYVFPGSFSRYLAGEVQLSSCMREYWASFVAGGSPNSTTCKVTWTPYSILADKSINTIFDHA